MRTFQFCDKDNLARLIQQRLKLCTLLVLLVGCISLFYVVLIKRITPPRVGLFAVEINNLDLS